MTHEQYKNLIKALKKQRKKVTSSKEEASKFIDELGIRDILIPIDNKKRVND